MGKELNFMRDVWTEWKKDGDVRCIECNRRLKFHPAHVSHILPKGNYGRFRLRHDNVVPMCFEHHQLWEFGDRKKMKCGEKLKNISISLKSEYFNGTD